MSDHRVPAIHRAFAILEAVRARGPLSLTELVHETGLNKSTVHYLLQTLVDHRALETDDDAGRRFRLGQGLVELGAAAAEHLTDITVAKRHLAGLLEQLNATFVLYRRVSPGEIVLTDKLERLSRVRITLPLGSRIPIQGGSFGRAFLAYDDAPTLDRLLEQGLQVFTPKSVVDRDEFVAELDAVRQRGWAVDHEGFALGVSTVAAPIFGADGRIRLVAAAVTFTSVLTDEVTDHYGTLLRDTCEAIATAIAHLAPSTPDPTQLGAAP